MHAKTIFIVFGFCLLLLCALAAAQAIEGVFLQRGAFAPEQFLDPKNCTGCHDTIHGEWQGSVHSLALQDPVFRAISRELAQTASTPAEKHEAEMCVRCHGPAAIGTSQLSYPGQPLDRITGGSAKSIFCDFCHTVTFAYPLENTSFYLSPGKNEDEPGIRRGPRENANSEYHESAYSELHTRSAFCGGCHDVRHVGNGTPLETAYSEWLAGPYSTDDPATTVNCQDCHMRQAPGIPATGRTARPDRPGEAAEGGPSRPHVWRHNVVGANAFLPGLFGDSGQRRQMAYERLQNCASLEVKEAYGPWRAGQPAVLRVKVINDGAGHSIPTGVTELRQMWLEVIVVDARGYAVFLSGAVDREGELLPNTVLYHTQLGDANGQPTYNIIKADRVLFDYRIPAGGYREEIFRFEIPAEMQSPLKVYVKLHYRSLPAAIIKMLGENAPEVPIIDMATSETSIPLASQ